MPNIKLYIKPLIIFLPLAILQITIIPLVSVFDVIPDLLIILLVFYTIQFGQMFGTVYGFLIGLLFDLLSGGLLGASMFSKTFTGFVVGYFHNENKVEDYLRSYWFIFIVFIAAMADRFIISVILLSDMSINIFGLIFTNGILPGIFTASVTIPLLLFKQRKGIR